MNRIREIRLALGLTQQALAEQVGTSQPTIDRLEKGERQLTEDWMRKIAKALDVTPADLIMAPTVSEFRDEAVPYRPAELEHLMSQLDDASKSFLTIQSDSLASLGIKKGDVRLFDFGKAAVDAVKTGDVVLVQAFDPNPQIMRAVTLLRQFVAPDLLITNRPTTNMAVTMVNPNFEAHIRAVMVPGKAPGPKSASNGTGNGGPAH